MVNQEPTGLIPPSPKRVPHPANGMTAHVRMGDGAVMSIIDPTHDSGLIWSLTWGNVEAVRYAAAGVLDSYNYLLSGAINTTEAIRRLRLLRTAHRELTPSPNPQDER